MSTNRVMMVPSGRAPKPSVADWDSYRPTIEQLYVDERRPLEGEDGVMSLMERRHGFCAKKPHYEYRIKKWGKKKNIKKEQWRTITNIVKQRISAGRPTEISFQGIPVPNERVKREMARYASSTHFQSIQKDTASHVLKDITISTPILHAVPDEIFRELPTFALEPLSLESHQDWTIHNLTADNVSLFSPSIWMQTMHSPVRISFEAFSWLSKLDWNMISQLSTQSDIVKVLASSVVQVDNLFYAPTSSFQQLVHTKPNFINFCYTVVSILNNIDDTNDWAIGRAQEWLASLKRPILQKFFRALPLSMLDVLREKMFIAAMRREDEVTVHAMLELGYDPRERIIVDTLYWQQPVLPLFRALSVRQFALAKTIVTHLSQIETESGLQDLLQQLTDEPESRVKYQNKEFSLDDWTELMRIPLAAGAAPTIQCFNLATKDEVQRLISETNEVDVFVWLERDLLAAALLYPEEYYDLRQPLAPYTSSRKKHIVTSLLRDTFINIDSSTPELRHALLQAMDVALRTYQFYAVEMIYLAGLQLDPPLASTTYTETERSIINDAWLSGDWKPLRTLIDTRQTRPARVKADNLKLIEGMINAKSQGDFDAAIAQVDLLREGDRNTFPRVWRSAAKFDRGEMALAAIKAWQTHPGTRAGEGHDGLLTLLRYDRVAAVSSLIFSDERFAKALNSADCSGDFTSLENLLLRSHAGRKSHSFPGFVTYTEDSNLQVVLRALYYHAIHKNDLDLMEWLILTGLETEELRFDFDEFDENYENTLAECGLDTGISGRMSRYLGNQQKYNSHSLPSLLSVAAQRNDRGMIRTLLRGGVDPKDSNALREAVRAKVDLATIQMLLSAAGSGSNRQYGVGAMREAIYQKDHNLVRHLAKYVDIRGLDTNSNRCGRILSPLGEAIQCQDRESAQFLIDSGVGTEALVTWTGMNGSQLKRLTPLLAAISMNDLSMVQLLASAKAELDYAPKLGLLRTPLQRAAELGNIETVKFLLSKAVPVDSKPFYSGGTPLQLTAMNGYVGVAKLLLEHGANVNHLPAEGDGRTAFEAAAEWGRVDMMTLLASWGVDLDLIVRPKPVRETCTANTEANAKSTRHSDESEDDMVYGTQYQRALIFAERRGQMASKRFVQHIRSEINKG